MLELVKLLELVQFCDGICDVQKRAVDIVGALKVRISVKVPLCPPAVRIKCLLDEYDGCILQTTADASIHVVISLVVIPIRSPSVNSFAEMNWPETVKLCDPVDALLTGTRCDNSQ